ncbi:hypothetical protein SMIR_31245 [Streptomyces mirabilis]|uniref:hypothetical protein n=1 Tax=Streptomyces mirabilis TaxID=68239 RepID=UPI001BAFF7DE|nr:hypothetical protein [Streptomyces mirabilis]QUW83065.1 hypothetical protein SMIR_31245 [Streptomyces mirabilis]
MSTTPQMSQQQGHQQGIQLGQQGPSTAPPQQFGQQQPMAFGPQMQQPFGQLQNPQQQNPQQQNPQQHIPLQQIPQHLQQQLQQMGQQQPFQQLLQQLGGQQQQQQAQVLTSGIAQHFWDVVTPLPGQPSILYLFIDNAWRPLVNPNQVTHDEVQQAFAYGQQVIGVYDANSNAVQAVIVNK